MRPGGLLRGCIKALRLPAPERRRAVEAVVQLVRASVELRVVPASKSIRLLGTLEHGEAEARVGATVLVEAALVGGTVTRVARRLPWRPSCLRQALATQRMLRRRGIAGRLHLGVTGLREAEAHAWVTVDGEPVVGRPGVERYVPLAAFG